MTQTLSPLLLPSFPGRCPGVPSLPPSLPPSCCCPCWATHAWIQCAPLCSLKASITAHTQSAPNTDIFLSFLVSLFSVLYPFFIILGFTSLTLSWENGWPSVVSQPFKRTGLLFLLKDYLLTSYMKSGIIYSVFFFFSVPKAYRCCSFLQKACGHSDKENEQLTSFFDYTVQVYSLASLARQRAKTVAGLATITLWKLTWCSPSNYFKCTGNIKHITRLTLYLGKVEPLINLIYLGWVTSN